MRKQEADIVLLPRHAVLRKTREADKNYQMLCH